MKILYIFSYNLLWIYIDNTTIISVVTFLVTLLCGFIVKRTPKFQNKIAILISLLFAGGVYDTIHNLKKIIRLS